MTATYRSGSVSVRVGDTLQDLAVSLVRKAYPEIVSALEEELGGVTEAARAEWPVRTGVSRAGLKYETIVTGDAVVGRISNRARRDGIEYAYLIRYAVAGGWDHVWTRTVRRRMPGAMDRIVQRAGPAIVAAAQRETR